MDLRHILLEVSAETGDATRELRELAASVEAFDRLSADARVTVDASSFRSELAAATGELTAFRAQHADASLGLDTKAFTAELAKARAELLAFGREHQSASPEHQAGSLSTSPLSGAIAAERDVRAVAGGGGGGDIPSPLKGAADDAENDGNRVVKTSQNAARGASDAFQGAALNISSLMSIGMAGVVAAIIAVIPEIVLLGASLVGAAAAAGGLATALAGAAGPALLAIIPLVSGLTKVFAAFKVDEQNKQLKQSILGRQQLANAVIQHARAEQQLFIARRDATRGIRDALHADQQATQAVGNAQFDLKIATRDAYRAWQDSINAVTDAMFALRDAQLAVQQAQLTKQQALLDLRNLRKEVAATGTELDHFFNKITEVQLDPKRVAALLPQVDRLGLSTQQSIDIKQKLLDISKANAGVGESEQKRREAEINLTRAIQRRNEFEQQGLKAYRPLVQAQQAAADASWAQARAAEHLADVQKQGVSNNPQVLAAQDALRTSNQQLTQATNKSRDAWAQVPKALRFLRRPLEELHRAYVDLRTEVTRTWAPVIGEAVRGATGFLRTFSSRIASLASTQARAAGRLIAGLESPRAQHFFDRMFKLADKLTTTLSSALGHLLGFLSNVADAATKPLERASHAIDDTFAHWDAGTRKGTTGGKRMARIFDEGTTALGKWFKLLGSLGQLLLSFFDVTSGQSNSLLDSLTKTVDKWNEWVNSKTGQSDIKDFFTKVLPAAKEAMHALGQLILVLIAALPTIIRLIGTAFDALSKWIRVLGAIYNFFHQLLPSSISAIGAALLGILVPLAIVRKAFGTLKAGAKGILEGIFTGPGGSIEKRVGDFTKKIGQTIRRGLSRLTGGRLFQKALGDAGGGAGAGEGVAAGGKAAGTEITAAMVEGGRLAGVEIARAMELAGRGGAVPTFGGPKKEEGQVLKTAERDAATLGEGAAAGAGARGGLRALLARGAPVGALGVAGGVGAAAYGVLTGSIPAAKSNSEAPYVTRAIRTFQGYASALTMGLVPSPASFNRAAAEMERRSEVVYQAALKVGRHSRAALLAFGDDAPGAKHSGLSTGILDQLRVSFSNLGERATGGIRNLRRVFNQNMQQISDDIPRHTRSWTNAVNANMTALVSSIGRNVGQGRIKVAEGFSEIERLMRSHMLRGRAGVVAGFQAAQKAIDRFKESSSQKLSQAATLAHTFLHRMGLSLDALKKNTDSVNTALSTLVGNAKLTVKEAIAIVKDAKTLPAPAEVPSSAFDQRRRRRGPRRVVSTHSRGGLIPGYGGGDQWPSLLESGEFVLRKEAVRSIGPAVLARLNTNPGGGDQHVEHHARAFASSVAAIAGAGAQSALGDFGITGPARVSFKDPRSGSGGGSGNTTNINVTTAPQPDLPPDPAILAAQLSRRMRARGLT